MLRISGTKMMEGSAEVRLNGVNDTVGFADCIFTRSEPLSPYRYLNQNFPNGRSVLPSASFRDFWWRYFWLCKRLGINSVRFNSGRWELDLLHSCWYKDRAFFDSLMTDCLDMAALNGVYVIFGFGGPNMDGSVDPTSKNGDPGTFDKVTFNFDKRANLKDPMQGSILEIGSEAYGHWVKWMGEVMVAYKAHPALGMWDLSNEPDSGNMWAQYWKALYPDPAAFKAAWAAFAQRLTDDIKAIDHTHPVLIGTGGGNPWEWGESDYRLRNIGSDIVGNHVYSSVNLSEGDQAYLIYQPKAWADALGKPMVNTEVGYSMNRPPWEYGYYPSYDAIARKYGIGVVWMQLNGCPNAVYDAASWSTEPVPVPAYPSYPIAQAVLDSIPPMPSDAPPAPQPKIIKVKLPPVAVPPFKLQLPKISATMPPVSIPASTATFVFLGKKYVVTIPAKSVAQPAVVMQLPEVTVQLPPIDIPEFELEVPE
jgi:hypothetical protein